MATTIKVATAAAVAAPASTDSYADGYAQLSAIAERLKAASGVTTVDTLVADVQAARALHRTLKQRLAAVRRELDADAAENEAGGAE